MKKPKYAGEYITCINALFYSAKLEQAEQVRKVLRRYREAKIRTRIHYTTGELG